MPEIIFNGPEGRLEGRYHPAAEPNAPMALILHPHPQYGGTMNNKVVYNLYHIFVRRGFSVLRFNFRGVGKSQGAFDDGLGELADAASALDWLQSVNPNAANCWVAGFSFGAWIAMQLLMRRPEIQGFIAVAPPANVYDFTFLAPCPSSGLIVQGDKDEIVTPASTEKLAKTLQAKRSITVEYALVKSADHFFTDKLDKMDAVIETYLDKRFTET
ncbi:MAG TPA: alpha/beta hydrolase [Sphingomonadales bacterium]|nr:alpha/beta hydrolase [Sphingomonadales bacterium]